MRNKIFLGVLAVIVLLGGWWIWENLFISPSTKLTETIEGVFYVFPTDPTVSLTGFRTCDGQEYTASNVIFLKRVNENEFIPIKYDPWRPPLIEGKDYDERATWLVGTFGLVNPTIKTGSVKVHGYEPGAIMECNTIEDVEKIIFVSDSECIPSVPILNLDEWRELIHCEADSDCSCFNEVKKRAYHTFKNICINRGSLEQRMSQYPNLYSINESEQEFCLDHICRCGDNRCVAVGKISQEVTITTDKTVYEQGEEISFTIKNNSSLDIFLTQRRCTDDMGDHYQGEQQSSMPYLQRFENSGWEDVKWHYFLADATAAKCPSSLECISKVEDINFSRIPTDFIGELLNPSIYRLKLDFGRSCQRNVGLHDTFTVYSNEFTVKEKEELVVDLVECKEESYRLWWSFGSVVVRVNGSRSGLCSFELTDEVEGGYMVYECSLPVSLEKAIVSADNQVNYSFNVTRFCRLIKSGNVFEDVNDSA